MHVLGPVEPGSTEWDIAGETRAYVRQEYKEWRDWEQEAADRREALPYRGADGADERAL
ncbi:hypothetical protein AB0H73_27360 [Streptomyces olivoreticuli]